MHIGKWSAATGRSASDRLFRAVPDIIRLLNINGINARRGIGRSFAAARSRIA